MSGNNELVEKLKLTGTLTSPHLIDVFIRTPRQYYLPEDKKFLEQINAPIPIGEGQTASQPQTIAYMLEHLKPKTGDRIVEIGYGSGWQTALLAKLVYPKGHIFAYEIRKRIAEFGESNLNNNLETKYRKLISLFQTDYTDSFAEYGPYDKIISGAAFSEKPSGLIKQLNRGGIMIFPSKLDDLRIITKINDRKYEEDIVPGFIFVPIVHQVID